MEDLKEKSSFPTLSWKNCTHQAILQSLHGFAKGGSRRVSSGQQPRTHLYAPNSVTLLLETHFISDNGWVAALHAAAPVSIPLGRWEHTEARACSWSLKNQKGATWSIRHPSLPAI